MTKYRNENEITIHSLGRSGSHAIVNWIASMFEEPVFFFNNCHAPGDPFKTRIPYIRRVRRRPALAKYFVVIPTLKRLAEDKISPFRNIPKQCLMYSYEHQDIRKLASKDFVQNRNFSVGRSKNRYNILILRDIYNWTASLLLKGGKGQSRRLSLYPKFNISKSEKWFEDASIIPGRNYRTVCRTIKFWPHYAREFLGETDFLKEKKICISFNHWFNDMVYRVKISKLLNLEYSDLTLDYGGSPSSFDRKKYSRGRAREMKILERWKIFKDNVVYQEVLDICPEVRELSTKIFGRSEYSGILAYRT